MKRDRSYQRCRRICGVRRWWAVCVGWERIEGEYALPYLPEERKRKVTQPIKRPRFTRLGFRRKWQNEERISAVRWFMNGDCVWVVLMVVLYGSRKMKWNGRWLKEYGGVAWGSGKVLEKDCRLFFFMVPCCCVEKSEEKEAPFSLTIFSFLLVFKWQQRSFLSFLLGRNQKRFFIFSPS